MEGDQEKTASMTEGGVVLNEDVDVKKASSSTETTLEFNNINKSIYATEKQFMSVFSNTLITDPILSYMNFADMKALRQVSHHFLGMIEAYKRFKDSQVLLITCYHDKSPWNDSTFAANTNQIIWRGIRIDVCLPAETLLNIPRPLIENAELICLYTSRLNVEQRIPLPNPIPPSAFVEVLNCAQKIIHLQLEHFLAMWCLLRIRSSSFNASLVEKLKNVEILEILGHENNASTHPYPYKDCYSNQPNINQIASIFQRLRSLRITNAYFYNRHKLQVQGIVLGLLERNRETIRELSLHLGLWENDNFRAVRLPSLNSLTVTVHEVIAQEVLRDFLANHHESLEELDVAVWAEFGRNLFDVISKHCCLNLSKFHMKAKKFVDVVGGRQERVDWNFLRGMSRLKDFQLLRPNCNNDDETNYWEVGEIGPRILESLPRNQLERLGLSGIGDNDNHGGFWRLNALEMEPELPVKLDLLRGFRNLRRLSFYRCPDAVDDDLMTLIVMEMTSLEEFEVTHCSRLTDAGLNGTSEDGSDSIRNLKGLKVLRILHCNSVTPYGLLSCLRFQFLRHFEYFIAGLNVTTGPFILGILSQNPSLESVGLNLQGRSSWKVVDEIRENNCDSRLKKITSVFGIERHY